MARPNKMVTYEGRTQTISRWAAELGCSSEAIYARLRHHGNPYGYRPGQTLAKRNEPTWEQDKVARRLVAEMGGMTLEAIAAHLGVTKERVRQIQNEGLRKLRKRAPELVSNLVELAALRDEQEFRGRARRAS